MVNAGRILILTKGDWSSLVTYEMLDLVSYDGVAYLARQASVGACIVFNGKVLVQGDKTVRPLGSMIAFGAK